MSTNVVVAATLGLLSNTRTTPRCSTTNQRDASFGAWSIATGKANDRPGNTRCTVSVTCGTPTGGDDPPPSPQPPAASAPRVATNPVHRGKNAHVMRVPT
jgi:hypothetical protein